MLRRMAEDAGIGGATAEPGSVARDGAVLAVAARLRALGTPLLLGGTLVLEGVEPEPLVAALAAEVCPGALLRMLPEGWSLDWPATRGLARLWAAPVGTPARDPPLAAPDDEAAAGCLRLLDAVALALGLGRGHVVPVHEHPLRRALDGGGFRDLSGLDPAALRERAAALAEPGIPVLAALVLRRQEPSGWQGLSGPLRRGRLHLRPEAGPAEARLPAALLGAGEPGFAALIARPLAEGVAITLPGGLGLPALLELLPAIEAARGRGFARLRIEGTIDPAGLHALAVAGEGQGRVRVVLPRLPGPEASAAMLAAVAATAARLGGRPVPGAGRVEIAAAPPALGRFLSALRAHPVLTRLLHRPEVGLFSPARRIDEQPAAVVAAAGAALERGEGPDPAELGPLLEGTEVAIGAAGLSLGAGTGEGWLQILLAAAATLPAGLPPAPADPALALPVRLEADLAALLGRLAAAGLPLPEGPFRARLAALCPLVGAFGGPWGRLMVRGALLDRALPGAWSAVALEVRLAGAAGGAQGACRVAALPAAEGAAALPLPLLPVADGRAGLLLLPLAPSPRGPCARRLPPARVGLSVHAGGREVARATLRPAPDWRRPALTEGGDPLPAEDAPAAGPGWAALPLGR